MQQFHPLAPWQEAELLEQSRNGIDQAKVDLIESYLPRVLTWASAWRGSDLTFAELIEIGNRSLVHTLSQDGLEGKNLEDLIKDKVMRTLEESVRLSAQP